jgi:hypothetical protein
LTRPDKCQKCESATAVVGLDGEWLCLFCFDARMREQGRTLKQAIRDLHRVVNKAGRKKRKRA